jgi:hypothetical protein
VSIGGGEGGLYKKVEGLYNNNNWYRFRVPHQVCLFM